MRFTIVTVLCLVGIFLASCTRTDTPAPPREPAAASAAGPSSAPAKAIPQPETGKLNVAFVYVGPVGDGGWTWAHDQGRRHLEATLNVHTVYVESVTEGAEADQVIRNLARKGFDLIIGTSFGYLDSLQAAAQDFPMVKFVHVSGFKANGTNLGSLFGAMESMKYLSGMIAGARAKADGQPKLGYVAPFPIPEVVRLANAVMLGAARTCPECTMEVRWINSWFDPTREREAAESLFKNGADVVITGADTPGPITAAKDANRWGIGYDSVNACGAAPERCLTASYWDWGPIYVDLVRRMQAGTWKGSHEYLDVPSGIVGLYGFMDGQSVPAGVPAEVVPVVRKALAAMRAGAFTRFDVFAGPLTDNTGKQVLPAGQKLSDLDLEGLPGCTVCMGWLSKGIVGQLPAR